MYKWVTVKRNRWQIGSSVKLEPTTIKLRSLYNSKTKKTWWAWGAVVFCRVSRVDSAKTSDPLLPRFCVPSYLLPIRFFLTDHYQHQKKTRQVSNS
jgi:hypothetical protein